MLLNDQELQQLAATIADVETTTDAEIVTVLAPQADSYAFIPALWAALISLSIPLFLMLIGFELTVPVILTLQWGLLGILTLLFRWQPVLRWVVPQFVQRHRAAQLARYQFLEQGLHHTEHETGVLIFVSELERYVEILTDRGICKVIKDNEWQSIIDHMTSRVKQQQTIEGFIDCIQQSGQLLAERLPPRDTNPNELCNQLIVLDYYPG